jgi:exodeoxyribonuclease VII small subunit
MDKSSYARTRERLEEIVTQVKAKDMPLEKSLDLYEEALRLGNVCAEMIDRTDFSAEELEGIGALEATEDEDGDAVAAYDDEDFISGNDD